MSKIKLVSGKEVNTDSLIFWILKSDLTINSCRLKDLDINTSYKEDKECSEIFATKQEAEEWLEKYKSNQGIQHVTKILAERTVRNKVKIDKINLNDSLGVVRESALWETDKIKPNYYKGKSGQDVLDVIEDFDLGFIEANILKYIIRYKNKNGLEDLKKASEYLQRKIKSLEK